MNGHRPEVADVIRIDGAAYLKRNRHCPKCQGAARAAWLQAREREVLDVEYFHVVFTLPHELAPLALQNRRAVYGMLFRAASETLLTLTQDPKHLGAEIGCLALLHTWGQNLLAHPHLHCVIRRSAAEASAPTPSAGSVVETDSFCPFAS